MSYYLATEIIREGALNTGLITTVTHGNLQEIDLKRQTLFPLVHVVPVTMRNDQRTATYSFRVYFLDLIDWNKSNIYNEANPYWGVDNQIDVFNQMSLAVQLFMDKINRGASYDANIRISVQETASFISNSFENLLSGVEVPVSITLPNASVTDGIC